MDRICIQDFDQRHQCEAMALINANLGEHFGHIDVSMNPDLFDIAKSYRKGVFLVALQTDGSVVGTGSLMPESAGVGRIARMHTARHQRRLGIGALMLEHLERRARESSFHTVVLETNLDWDSAIAFYLKNEYVETARDDVEVHMCKRLA